MADRQHTRSRKLVAIEPRRGHSAFDTYGIFRDFAKRAKRGELASAVIICEDSNRGFVWGRTLLKNKWEVIGYLELMKHRLLEEIENG